MSDEEEAAMEPDREQKNRELHERARTMAESGELHALAEDLELPGEL